MSCIDVTRWAVGISCIPSTSVLITGACERDRRRGSHVEMELILKEWAYTNELPHTVCTGQSATVAATATFSSGMLNVSITQGTLTSSSFSVTVRATTPLLHPSLL